VAVACGYGHTVALTHVGKVVCWGDNDDDQCSVHVHLERVIGVYCGNFRSVAVTQAGNVVSWGCAEKGQCLVPEGLEDVLVVSVARIIMLR
jgi:alpha-tubulin suppressor-like RCC1 family protein